MTLRFQLPIIDLISSRALPWLAMAILCSSNMVGFAQIPVFRFDQSIEVYQNGEKLANPWAGGVNAPQYNKLDLNGNGTEDLVVFDRTNGKISTFLAVDGTFQYAPEYEDILPPATFWMQVRDYDGDGKKDIFSGTSPGLKVYKNVGSAGSPPEWELIKDPVLTQGFSGFQINLKVEVTDIPAIIDIDNDGDLDILTAVPNFGGAVELHLNLSQEMYGHSDSLVFDKVTERWGGFKECGNCKTFIFDDDLACRVGAIEHNGSALAVLDLGGDGPKDLLLGEVDCSNLVRLVNEGTVEEARFTQANLEFPIGHPVDMDVFPSPFLEDVDFDGQKDLLVSPNVFFNEADLVDFANSTWLYKNTGTAEEPEFEFVQKNFLQADMIDLGEGARPTFADVDGDGLTDMVVANRGKHDENGQFYGTLHLFKNTGTEETPAFELVDDDYLGFSQFNWVEIKQQFVDLNGDGALDLAFASRTINTQDVSIKYLLNQNTSPGAEMAFDLAQLETVPVTIERLDEPYFFDMDNDGHMDLLVGKFRSNLELWLNDGDFDFALETNAVNGIRFNNLRREVSIAITDLFNNGRKDLVVGDLSGQVRVYLNVRETYNEDTEPLEMLVYNTVNSQNEDHFFGNNIFPTFYGNRLFIGSRAGGIFALEPHGVVGSIGDKGGKLEIKVDIFPNPSSGEFYVQPAQDCEIQVYNIIGKAVTGPMRLSGQDTHTVNTTNWEPGIYLVKINFRDGHTTKKVIIR